MNYLFLDLSTTSTGWAVSNSQGNLIKYGCITSSHSNYIARIIHIKEQLYQIINEYNIKYIVAEEVHLDNFKNTHTYKLLIYLQYAMLEAMYSNDPKIKFEFIQANSWRSRIGIKTGRGIKRESLKKADMQYVKEHYDIAVNDDIADAICLKDAFFKDNGFDWSE